jgi:tetratricopeptide (TPR) repeat protein
MALAWLRGRLARFGFQIVIVGGTDDLEGEVGRAFEAVSPGDAVFLHVSGRLWGREALAANDESCMPLQALCEGLDARTPGRVSFVAEFTHDEDPDDALAAAECLETAMRALGARRRGHYVLAAVRSSSSSAERVAFTRLAFPPPTASATGLSDDALLTAMYERASSTAESFVVAQSFTFARGGSELPPPPPTEPSVAAEQSTPEPLQAAQDPTPSAPPPSAITARGVQAVQVERPLDELIEEATQARDWNRALELRRRRLDATEGSRHKVKELIAIARILQAELHDAEAAIHALEVARAIDRSRLGVLQALRRGYESLGRWENVSEVLSTMAEVTATPADRAALRYAQARIALDHLADEARATASLEAALEEDPTHAAAASELGRLRQARGELDAGGHERSAEARLAEGNEDAALADLERAAAMEPLRASLYFKAFDVHRRAGRTDAALLAAMSLEELGAAEVDQQVLIGQFRQVTPVRVRASFDEAAWQSLRAPGSDDVLAAIFTAVGNAAISTRVEELRRRRKLTKVDPTHRLSETSTASVARSFQWAARVLPIECPDLYLAEQVPGGVGALTAASPSTALGPEVLSGRSAKDLAFIAGRHLTYYRPEYQVLIYYPTREDLTNLLLAAVQIAMPEPSSPSLGAPVKALHARMERRIEKDEREALQDAVARLDARGGRATIGAWIRSVEMTANRVGLFLCGDLASAAAVVRGESRTVGGVPLEAKRGDLVGFCASRAHAALRAGFISTAPESMRPVPSTSGVHVVV